MTAESVILVRRVVVMRRRMIKGKEVGGRSDVNPKASESQQQQQRVLSVTRIPSCDRRLRAKGKRNERSEKARKSCKSEDQEGRRQRSPDGNRDERASLMSVCLCVCYAASAASVLLARRAAASAEDRETRECV